MKLKHLDSYLGFIQAVQQCEGDVFFHSAENDHLCLKSTLSRYLFASVCGDRAFLEAGEVECKLEADYAKLRDFLVPKAE